MAFNQSQQFFSQSQQSYSQAQQVPWIPPQAPSRQQLATLSPADREAIYGNILLQSKAIHFLPNETLSNLHGYVVNSIPLIQPLHDGDTMAIEAARVFYSQNEFVISITTITNFINWTVGNTFKPSDMITRLAVRYGDPHSPGGGNSELKPLLSMPNLLSIRLIFQDYPRHSKTPGPSGPYAYLRPSIGDIMLLKNRQRLNLQLQLKYGCKLPGKPEDIDPDDVDLQDIMIFLQPPSTEEARIIAESHKIWRRYTGPASYCVSALVESGWSWEDGERVVLELWVREAVQDWIEQERLNALESQDIEMS